ncbi:hypothetical protein K493DRAFT_351312 [Basidiobolus meristosporus CBS 931.73]|uniref:Complex 1 LYR protein domain-containing protein n=1 Tax=Basidiobolus meristosporus CBS 931.73 TaxID=1314790 RepID=A0A1Y1YCU0_9FUNG|nr:hypothetical protein K493DRAFT_351312 [Basidiobolus meristosporus CBS 931.73]|eukprot:ORX95755.1 hypothetical protein K493DRAFT_351312 [Basidiobolus meristosporus CBS 931.73]
MRVPAKSTAPVVNVAKEHICSLYRGLLRNTRGLRYSDKDFVVGRIREEFKNNMEVNKTRQEKLVLKAEKVLENNFGGLL